MEETGMNYLWSARKRNALGLPWTFTKYAFTEDRLFVTTGLLKTVEDEVRLYRILDISLSRTLLQKILAWERLQYHQRIRLWVILIWSTSKIRYRSRNSFLN